MHTHKHKHVLTLPFIAPTHSDWVGNVTFTYTVSDGKTNDTGTVTLVVVPPPQVLVAKDDYYVGEFNTPLDIGIDRSILANDGPSPTGGTLRMTDIIVDVSPADGKLTQVVLANGTFRFTPADGFYGNTSFVYSEPRPQGFCSFFLGFAQWSRCAHNHRFYPTCVRHAACTLMPT